MKVKTTEIYKVNRGSKQLRRREQSLRNESKQDRILQILYFEQVRTLQFLALPILVFCNLSNYYFVPNVQAADFF
jgi:hypothetical protein